MLSGVGTKSVQLCMCVYLEKEKKVDMKKVSEGQETQAPLLLCAPLLYREGSLGGDAQVAGRSGKRERRASLSVRKKATLLSPQCSGSQRAPERGESDVLGPLQPVQTSIYHLTLETHQMTLSYKESSSGD